MTSALFAVVALGAVIAGAIIAIDSLILRRIRRQGDSRAQQKGDEVFGSETPQRPGGQAEMRSGRPIRTAEREDSNR